MSVATTIRTQDDATLAIGAAGSVLLALAFLAFLLTPALTTWPLLAFVGLTLAGLVLRQGSTVKYLVFVATVSTLVILSLITVYLAIRALPVIVEMGPGLVLETTWDTAGDTYGLVTMMWGTFVTTLIATAVAAPLGVAGAIFISELAPDVVREVVKPAVEMLAGIPSIVYGFIGFALVNPYLMNELGAPNFGSLGAVGIVIGLMALPTVVSVAEDAIDSVPGSMKDGAQALGATEWQTTTSVTLPAAFSGISAAVLLGVGRAVGETMAATVILGNIADLPEPLVDVFGNTITLTSLIASQYGNASASHLSALFAAGVVLFVTVMALSVGAQLIERRMREKLGGPA